MKKVIPLLLSAAAAGIAAVPQFSTPFTLQVNNSDLITDVVANQFFYDWNGDGINDMIVDWSSQQGKVRIYRYYLTSTDPVSLSYLPGSVSASFVAQATGNNLTVGLVSNPFMVDWNGDGFNDLIVGQFIEGKVRFYPNFGTNQDPLFMTYTYLQADGADITSTYS